jgi:hypothetical protein
MANLGHEMTQPFSIADVVTAVDAILMHTRFDVNNSDNDLDWPESQSDSDDNEESDKEYKHHSSFGSNQA